MFRPLSEEEKIQLTNLFVKAIDQNFILITSSNDGKIDFAYNTSDLITAFGLLTTVQLQIAKNKFNFQDVINTEKEVENGIV
jgi:hypothetical protein